jgi:lia operon protein LiaF
MERQKAKQNLFWGFMLIFFGILFMLDNFNIMDFGDFIWTFWPVILIIIGIKIIMDKRSGGVSEKRQDKAESVHTRRSNSSRISESNVFGDINVILDTQKFEGGSINNVFGDIRVDIAKIQLDANSHKLFISGIFGDITVILPENIAYRIKTSVIAGDLMVFGNKRDGIFPSLEHTDDGYNTAPAKLFVQVSGVFGSINILAE